MYNYLKYIGLTKGVLTITDIISVSENKKRVLVRCLCSKCGHYSEVRLDRFTISVWKHLWSILKLYMRDIVLMKVHRLSRKRVHHKPMVMEAKGILKDYDIVSSL